MRFLHRCNLAHRVRVHSSPHGIQNKGGSQIPCLLFQQSRVFTGGPANQGKSWRLLGNYSPTPLLDCFLIPFMAPSVMLSQIGLCHVGPDLHRNATPYSVVRPSIYISVCCMLFSCLLRNMAVRFWACTNHVLLLLLMVIVWRGNVHMISFRHPLRIITGCYNIISRLGSAVVTGVLVAPDSAILEYKWLG